MPCTPAFEQLVDHVQPLLCIDALHGRTSTLCAGGGKALMRV